MTKISSGQAIRRRINRILAAGAFAGALAACSNVEPMSFTPIDEIPPGPGVFSGEDGVFTLYDSGRPNDEEEEGTEQ